MLFTRHGKTLQGTNCNLILFHSVMDNEIPCTNDLQSNEYDTNGVAYPNCEIDPEKEAVEEGMLTNA